MPICPATNPRRHAGRRLRSRGGFSLLEVILAATVLLGSAIVLFELAAIGREHVNSTEQLALAQRLCETRINEILAGQQQAKAVEKEELLDYPGWNLAVEVDPVSGQTGLSALRVTVFREADAQHRAKRYTLVRWVRDGQQQPSSPSDSASSSSPPPPAEGVEP
ncbi:MAG: hypothetical protein GXY83_30510 [Rhodopirellula sp.]|nr:hypothetical protein [Rhodopirellula sp.]